MALVPIIAFFAIKVSDFINIKIYISRVIEKLRPILRKIANQKDSDIFILLDVSESMSFNKKIEYAKEEMIKTLTSMKGSRNKIGLITFGGYDLIKSYDLRENYSEIINIIKDIKACGTTPMLDAIKLAHEKIKKIDPNRRKCIYIITDGNPTDCRGIVPELEDEILKYMRNDMKNIMCEINIKGIDANCKTYFFEQMEKICKDNNHKLQQAQSEEE